MSVMELLKRHADNRCYIIDDGDLTLCWRLRPGRLPRRISFACVCFKSLQQLVPVILRS